MHTAILCNKADKSVLLLYQFPGVYLASLLPEAKRNTVPPTSFFPVGKIFMSEINSINPVCIFWKKNTLYVTELYCRCSFRVYTLLCKRLNLWLNLGRTPWQSSRNHIWIFLQIFVACPQQK